MSGRRLVWLVATLALAASQGGHLLSYQLRYGGSAGQLQGSGAHAYFPTLVKTGLGAAAIVSLIALLAVGFARVASGRPIPRAPAPPLLRLIAGLFTVQLACFALQETAEAALGGASASSPVVLLLWGTAGQLPVAIAAAIALRWLIVRLGPAVAQLRLLLAPAYRRFVYALAPRALPRAIDACVPNESVTNAFNRRGPPF